MKLLLFASALAAAVSAVAINNRADSSSSTLAPPVSPSKQFSFIPPSDVHSFTGQPRPTSTKYFGIMTPTRATQHKLPTRTSVSVKDASRMPTVNNVKPFRPVGTFSGIPKPLGPPNMPAPIHVKPEEDLNKVTCLIPGGCGPTAVEVPEPTTLATVVPTSHRRPSSGIGPILTDPIRLPEVGPVITDSLPPILTHPLRTAPRQVLTNTPLASSKATQVQTDSSRLPAKQTN